MQKGTAGVPLRLHKYAIVQGWTLGTSVAIYEVHGDDDEKRKGGTED